MFEKIKKIMNEKYNLVFDEDAKDFTDFSGTINNFQNEPFEVEGSIELNGNEVSYSIAFTDVNRGIEYDGMIGTMNINENNINDVMESIFEPNFVECK